MSSARANCSIRPFFPSRLAPAKRLAVPAINLALLGSLRYELAGLSTAERATHYGLREDRADLILPATLVIGALAEIFALRVLLVPGTGIRDAVLRSLVIEETARAGRSGPRRDRRLRLACQLFELLATVHNIWPPGLAVLEAAAHKLPPSTPRQTERTSAARTAAPDGLDDAARQMAGAAALLSTGLRDTHRQLVLSPENQTAAKALAAILRLATALSKRPGTGALRSSLMSNPVVIDAGLSQPLPRAVIEPLERALGRRFHVV